MVELHPTILVVVAHPDDEVLGCGATIVKYASMGSAVHVIFFSDGVSSRETGNACSEALVRQAAAQSACRLLGVRTTAFLNYPDNRLDEIGLLELVKAVEAHLTELNPQIVLTHHGHDLNVDHRRVHQAVATACRAVPNQCVRTLLHFEIPSSTEWQVAPAVVFVPNWFEDVTLWIENKMTALQAYSDEMREWPHARSLTAIEALMRWRGAMVGVAAAEAFMLGRRLA
ncbi:MAG TPA: PIG-L family deacetylase [Burkholderiaceae bacterium]|nr:PIG-L family deacetylase [Burkholderiaceae bacterium]